MSLEQRGTLREAYASGRLRETSERETERGEQRRGRLREACRETTSERETED